MQIKNIFLDEKEINLTPDLSFENGNVFTILVGRNGVGKSRILKAICHVHLYSLMDDNSFMMRSALDSEWFGGGKKNKSDNCCVNYSSNGCDFGLSVKVNNDQWHNHVSLEKIPDEKMGFLTMGKIIAVSSSPFDKFPILSRFDCNDFNIFKRYCYRGAKVKSNSSSDYLKTKFDQLGASLINFFLVNDKSKSKVLILLNQLGFDKDINISFSFPFPLDPHGLLTEIDKSISEKIRSVLFFKGLPEVSDSITDDVQSSILHALRVVMDCFGLNEYSRGSFSISASFFNGNAETKVGVDILDALSLLAFHNIIELTNIEFFKGGRGFYLTDASSGELSIIFNLLSIAGEIENDAIVLIDEPEISLHPEWQNNFIPMLNEMFCDYNGCHFLIATHSPQILSSAIEDRSFVVNLDNSLGIVNANDLINKSSDYQLAHVFNEPGSRNEYLTRIALNVINNYSKNKKLSDSDLGVIQLLLDNSKHMDKKDPLYKVILSIASIGRDDA